MKKATMTMKKETLEAMAQELNIATEGLTKRQIVDAINAAADSKQEDSKQEDSKQDKKAEEKAKKAAERAAKKAARTFDAMKDRLPKLMGAEYMEPRHGGVLVRYGKERVFRYTGTKLICTSAKYLAGVDGAKYLDKAGYYDVPATTTNVFQIYYNVATLSR